MIANQLAADYDSDIIKKLRLTLQKVRLVAHVAELADALDSGSSE